MPYLQKYIFLKETKYRNVKAFNMIKNKDEALTEHIACECKGKLNI